MQAGTRGSATQREVEMLATPGERGVIGRGQVETQHPEDRRQEAFSLPQGVVLPVLVVAGKVAIRLAPVVEGVLQALGAGLDRGLLDGSLGQMFLELEQVAV